MEEKPITFVTSYRGVPGYQGGLHQGRTKDVIISDDPYGDHNFVSMGDAVGSFINSERQISELGGRIEKMIVYLGAQGAGPGFQYVRRLMEQNGNTNIELVACDCDGQWKVDFSREYSLPIRWSECGGEKTLARLVKKELEI
tara:strand:+ start:633 stop:1058 length:426 start_codon:yes stop_codon:yes gene_type:complete